jgi:TolB protein
MTRPFLARFSLVLAFGCLLLLFANVLSSSIEAASGLARVQATPSPTPTPVSHGSLPVVSPDGSRIAFSSNRGGAPDLFVIDADGANERQLTHTPEPEGNLAWTRDGRQILFSNFKDEVSRLYAIDLDGHNQRELAKVPGRAPTLSPDGKRLVYMAGTWTATKLMVSASDGSNAIQITDGSSIAWNNHWSPDGRRIAFAGRDNPQSELAVFLMNADGSQRRQLTHVPAEEGGAQWPVWSADGRRLAIQVNSRTQKNSAHIWIVEVATGAAHKIAAHGEAYLDETPSWFPDGKRIAFQSNRSGKMEVWVMNVDGSGQRQVTGAPPLTLGGSPLFSPDKSRILFISNRSAFRRLITPRAP